MPSQTHLNAIHVGRWSCFRSVEPWFRADVVPILLLVVLAVPARGQELVAMGESDIQYSLPSPTYCDSCDHAVDDCSCGGVYWPRFGMYVKSGPSFQMSENFFAEGTNVGYEISFGGREPLLPGYRNVFFDLGGSYLSAFGTGRSVDVESDVGLVPMTLKEIGRASVHASLGWYYDFSEVPEISRLLTMRFGGRLSHVRGHFDSPIDHSPVAKDRTIGETDTAPGILGGIEWMTSRPMGRAGTLAFVIDGEFASDWIDFQNYADGSLATATLMLGLSINR